MNFISPSSNRGFLVSCAFFCLCVQSQIFGQETASVTGQVFDPNGAVVARATVTVRNERTGATFSTTSDETGFYRAPQLVPGTYGITVSLTGFRTLARPGIEVRVNDRLRVDMTLEIGSTSETVTVVGQVPLLQTEDTTAGQVIDTKKIVDLPL